MDEIRRDITRISDLPESMQGQGHGQGQGMNSQQYQPINIHKNPYGIPEPTEMQLPQMSAQRNNNMGGGSGGFSGEMMQQSPPQQMNRGTHADTTAFQQDEYMIPNHVPATKLTTDYLKDHEEKMKLLAMEHKKELHQKDLLESVYNEFQIPILIGVLFFLFQIPALNYFMFKHLSFLKIFGEDGNLNLYGLIFKSTLFGLVYFGFIRITSMI
jgi:hypothetical protein